MKVKLLLSAISLLLCLEAATALAQNPVSPLKPNDEEFLCQKEGGKWYGTEKGRGRIWGCVKPTKDAGKSCTDGSDCESGYCVQAKVVCDGKEVANPHKNPEADKLIRSGKRERCQYIWGCYGENFPPKGCSPLMENGKENYICMD